MISKKSGFSRFGQFAAAMSFLGLVALACLLPLRARAYLDPGTGSYVVQILIGVALGAGYTLKVYGAVIYQRITGKQGKVKSEKGKG